MEDRVDAGRETRGAALIAFAAIAAISLMWWALALWPAGSAEPEWLARTRAACFGSTRGGLPDAGGWILLIGEPIGMFTLLGLLYRSSLAADFRWMARHPVLRPLAAGSTIGAMLLVGFLGVNASGVWAATRDRERGGLALHRLDREPPAARLVDQHGRAVNLRELGGSPVLLTVAFGHCGTVCPATVRQLLTERRVAGREDVPMLIVTVDPWRDTPDRLPTLARQWALGQQDRVLSGDIAVVSRFLDELGIGRRRNTTTGDVEHTSTAFVIDARGRLAWRGDGGPRELAGVLGKLQGHGRPTS